MVDFKVHADARFASLAVQHLDEDLHLAVGQRQEVLVPLQADLLIVGGTHLARLHRTTVGQAKQLDHVAQLRDVGLENAVTDVTIDALQLESIQLDDRSHLEGHAEDEFNN